MTYETFFFKHGLMYLIQKIDVCDRVRNGTIIDAGAYVGDSAVMFSEITERVIYAFEPISSNYQLLMKTIELNGLNNKIIAIEKGLGDKDEIIYTNAEKEGSMLTLSNSSDNSQIKHNTIQMTTLDNFVAEHNISVDLIKVDVEGFEQKFLSGALQTIKKYKPVILLSIYHNASDFFKLKPMLEELNIGYEFIIRHLHPTNFYADTMLICWPTQLK
jgi:FkbM family methyltransferase